MIKFPEIKKEVIELVSNEDGRISHDSLIRLGIIAIGSLGFATSVHAVTKGTTGDSLTWEYDEGACEDLKITCKDTIDYPGDMTMTISAKEITAGGGDMGMGGMGMGSCNEANANVRKWVNDHFGELEVENFKTTKICNEYSQDFPCEGSWKISPPHTHGNSINIVPSESISSEITASHEHSIDTPCDVKVIFKVGVNCDAEYAWGRITVKNDGQEMFNCYKKRD